ncbi:unnamed protein product [Prorocentrum cordatum]|uniref:Uncharacterized protein n=1 Tax=Prorocentrum cordatum TaxID=2364126 RepID=A0ABN9VV99_9DINO|nr:unnamed protein product [Polarella glacialis]
MAEGLVRHAQKDTLRLPPIPTTMAEPPVHARDPKFVDRFAYIFLSGPVFPPCASRCLRWQRAAVQRSRARRRGASLPTSAPHRRKTNMRLEEEEEEEEEEEGEEEGEEEEEMTKAERKTNMRLDVRWPPSGGAPHG